MTERNRVIVTGAAGRLGARLLRQLHRRSPVTGVDERQLQRLPEDVQMAYVDPMRSRAREIFALPDVGAIVHLGVRHDPRATRSQTQSENVRAFERVLRFAEQFQIPKVILLSSANAYGPRPENAQFLDESAPLLASGRFTEMRALVELDMHAQTYFWRQPDCNLVILRPTNILGSVRNAPSNYLRLSTVPTLMGFDPMLQVIHEDDVVAAIIRALDFEGKGIFNLAGPAATPLSRMLDILGRDRMPVPYTLAKGGLGGLFRLGLSRFATAELDFIRYVCMVDDSAAREQLGYTPRFGLEATLRGIDRERWVREKESP